jgi:UDPglucose 6-dehydrogenase
MRIGLIGVGVVGGTLKTYFEKNTQHELRLLDPAKGYADSLEGVDACFVSVPVPSFGGGQDLTVLEAAVKVAKSFCEKVFVRSTVLPGTNDRLGTIAMPEFLTERRADQDMASLPIICGQAHKNHNVEDIFPHHEIIYMGNREAELAKFTHNCFGALKVTYFNVIHKLCKKYQADFETVKVGAGITGFIETQHTKVPGPDGKFGYGGKCFPENVAALRNLCSSLDEFPDEAAFFAQVQMLNNLYRHQVDEDKIDFADASFL